MSGDEGVDGLRGTMVEVRESGGFSIGKVAMGGRGDVAPCIESVLLGKAAGAPGEESSGRRVVLER